MGVTQERVAVRLPEIPVTEVGAAGTAGTSGETDDDEMEAALVPAALVAVTAKV